MTIDHVTQGLSRLPERLKDKPKFVAFLTAMLEEIQLLEDAAQDVRGLTLDTATDHALEQYGELVGQPRQGVTDDDLYRRYIRARIATNRARGTIEELIRISRLVLDDEDARIEVERHNVATIILRVREVAVDDDIADIVITFLRDAKAGGVRLLFESSSVLPGATFTLDSGPGLDVGVLESARW